MKRLVVFTNNDLADGFRLAGAETYGVDSVEETEERIKDLINEHAGIVLAVDDSYFSQISETLKQQIYNDPEIILVTIPDGSLKGAEYVRERRIYDMIRHATGIQIVFKGE